MQVEHVARVRLAARRAAQQQRQLAVGDRLLRQIVVDDERVAAAVAEVLGHRDAGVGREELQRRRLRRGGGDDRRVLHRAGLAQLLDHRGDRRLLLADGDVEAVHVLALLVDDRVDRDGGLAGLAVADDQLALAAADRDHRVDRLDAGLHRLVHRLAGDDAGRLDLDLAACPWLSIGPLPSIGWPSALTTRPTSASPTGTSAILPVRLTVSPSLDRLEVAEQRDADVVLFEVQHQADDALAELEQLAGHRRPRP